MTTPDGPGEITRLLHAWRGGNGEALDELWPIVYGELRRLAGGVLRRQGRRDREQATSLVHKAYLRLLGSQVGWNDRRHFFILAARAMRFVLADEARRQLSLKRGEGRTLNLDGASAETADPLAAISASDRRAVQDLDRFLRERQPMQPFRSAT